MPGAISIASVQSAFDAAGRCTDAPRKPRCAASSRSLLTFVHDYMCPRFIMEAMAAAGPTRPGRRPCSELHGSERTHASVRIHGVALSRRISSNTAGATTSLQVPPSYASQLVVLFGSEAPGTAHASSDIDLGIAPSEPEAFNLPQFAVTLERLPGRHVHVVLLEDAPPLLRSEISRYGMVLLERRPYLWADFRAKAMIDWWDWQPTAALIDRTMAARLREEATRGPS